MNYPTSLIGEIWFDLQNKQLLGDILLSLLVRFGLIYMIWVLVLGLYLGDVNKGLLLVLGPLLLILRLRLGKVGLRANFLNPISCPPALGYGERGQGLYRFLDHA